MLDFILRISVLIRITDTAITVTFKFLTSMAFYNYVS